ncbi:MAG: aminotransferase class I/II-fold pyridoxal phosphate-dependent enzyme [Burkholderiaceae bacterium]
MASLSRRAQATLPFYVMEIMARAERRDPARGSLVSMVVGEPDFPTPAPVVEAAAKALRDNKIHYTHALGLASLREAIAADYGRRDQIRVSEDQVAVTAGASAALLLAMLAILDAGDEVLVTDPGYPCNKAFVQAAGGQPVSLRVGPETHFQPTLAHVEAHWGPKTRALLVASPANPTGCLMPRAEAERIAAFVADKGGWLLADEIYLRLCFEPGPRSMLDLGPHVISINSFSKTFSMTGWRLGWLVGPQDIMAAMERLSQNLFISPSGLAQQAAVAAFTPDALSIAEEYRLRTRAQAEYVLPALEAIGFRLPVRPDGAFYGYFDVSSLAADSHTLCGSLCDDIGVLMAPGRDFTEQSPERMLRVSFPKPRPTLEEGVSRLERYFLGRKALQTASST